MGYWIYGTLAIAVGLFLTALTMIMMGAPAGQIVAVVATLWLMGLTSLMVALLIFCEPWFRRLLARLKSLLTGNTYRV